MSVREFGFLGKFMCTENSEYRYYTGTPSSRPPNNSGRRECVKCGALFTPILEINGSKQLLCHGCGVVKPVRAPSPDSRGTPSPMRNSPSPSPFKDKKKQVKFMIDITFFIEQNDLIGIKAFIVGNL